MRKHVVEPVMGLMVFLVMLMSAHGAGNIYFANYGSNTDAPVYFDGVPIGGSTWSASLYYGLGTISDASFLVNAGHTASFYGSADGDVGNGAGYFHEQVLVIPDYVSGPITFMVTAWKNSGPFGGSSYETSMLRGATPLFTLNTIPTGIEIPGEFGPLLQPIVIPVPEPSAFALGLAGTIALLIFRKRSR